MVCIDDPPIACDDGQMNYAGWRQQFLEKYQGGCRTDTDCVVLAPVNRCESGCGYAAVFYLAVDDLTTNLKNDADKDCVGCAQDDAPPCDPPMAAHCVMGQCTLDSN